MEAASHQRTSQTTPGDNTTLNTKCVTHNRSQLSGMESPGDLEEWCHQSRAHRLAELSRKKQGCQ